MFIIDLLMPLEVIFMFLKNQGCVKKISFSYPKLIKKIVFQFLYSLTDSKGSPITKSYPLPILSMFAYLCAYFSTETLNDFILSSVGWWVVKGGFFSENAMKFFQISKSQKKKIFQAQDSFLEYSIWRFGDLKNESHFLKKSHLQ